MTMQSTINSINLFFVVSFTLISSTLNAQSPPFPKWQLGLILGGNSCQYYKNSSNIDLIVKTDKIQWNFYGGVNLSYIKNRRWLFNTRLIYEQKYSINLTPPKYRTKLLTGSVTVNNAIRHKKISPRIYFLYPKIDSLETVSYFGAGIFTSKILSITAGGDNVQNNIVWEYGIVLRLFNHYYPISADQNLVSFTIEYSLAFGLSDIFGYKTITGYGFPGAFYLPSVRVGYTI